MGRSALILGATGLVGAELLSLLLTNNHYHTIKVLTRRELKREHTKLKQYIVNFDELNKYEELFQVDDVFCCLGTTIKKAKTKENFRKVDLDYPLSAAKIASEKGAENFMVISSMGADEKSLFFYSRVKGELERELKMLRFKAIHIFRPSLLVGNRTETRLGERFAEWLSIPLSPLLVGKMKTYRPIKGRDVAKAMIHCALSDGSGIHTHTSNKIQKLSKQ